MNLLVQDTVLGQTRSVVSKKRFLFLILFTSIIVPSAKEETELEETSQLRDEETEPEERISVPGAVCLVKAEPAHETRKQKLLDKASLRYISLWFQLSPSPFHELSVPDKVIECGRMGRLENSWV